MFEYPDCDEGRVVADVVRMNKGHTVGLEPNVTATIVSMMTQCKWRQNPHEPGRLTLFTQDR